MLEIGCGTGANAIYLARQRFEVTAVDASPLAIERARLRCEQQNGLVRFVLAGRFPEQAEATMRAVNQGREITLAMAELFNNELREMELDREALELAAHATFGTAASATDWWLGPNSDTPRRMSREKFIAHLTTIMMGAIIGTTELLGIRIDPELPIHKAVLRESRDPAGS